MKVEHMRDFILAMPNHATIQYLYGAEWVPVDPSRMRIVVLPFDARQKEKSHDHL